MFKKMALIGSVIVILCVIGFYFEEQRPEKPVSEDFAHVNFFESSRGPASHGKGKRIQSSKVIFRLKENLSESQSKQIQTLLKEFGIEDQKKFLKNKVRYGHIRNLKNRSEEEIAQLLQATGAVQYAEVDTIARPHFMGNDPNLSSQWHHSMIRSYEAWDMTLGSKTIIAASCDTGVDPNHTDLKASLLPGYNIVDESTSNLVPVNPHGTMTAGAMAAVANNGIGVSGVAGNIRILPLRVSNTEDGGASISTLVRCIEYAADNGAKVVNVSYAGADNLSIDSAAEYLRSKGGLLVMSAGNQGMDISFQPDFKTFLNVGSTDGNDNRAEWSNYGGPIDLVAPGVDVLTTELGGSYAYGTGTSFSAPLVSGAAALVYSINPNFTAAQVETFLLSKARPLGTGQNDPTFGAGRLDVGAAVAAAKRTSEIPKETEVLTLAKSSISADLRKSLAFTTRFNAAPMPKKYGVFVHFVDEKGHVREELNYSPGVPTTDWNGLVTDDRSIHVSPRMRPGNYTVRMGLYETVGKKFRRIALKPGAGVSVDSELRYIVGLIKVQPQIQKK